MLTLFDFHDSGNGYKIRLTLHFLQRAYRYVEVDILNGGSRTPEFLRRNPNGRIPVLELDDGRMLSESNAILFYLAQDTALWPTDRFTQAQIMSWLFFEQYNHEPNIATSRFIRKHRKLDDEQKALLAMKRAPGTAALELMDSQLAHTDYLVGDGVTIADIALYAYTHVAPEGGFDLTPYAGIGRWLKRMTQQSHYVPISHVDGLSAKSV